VADLDNWLRQPTRNLARGSVAQVRTEIREHYESARDAAIADGATTEDAESRAVRALGDAKAANCQYCRVLLTSAEARLLREGNWEARAVCRHPQLKRLAIAVPMAIVLAAAALFFTGHTVVARDVLICGIGLSPLSAALLLPINTRSRSRVFRYTKWIVMTGAVVLLFGQDALKWSWLLFSCLGPLAWTELDACFNQAEAPDQGLAPASVPLKLRCLGFAGDFE
jgi:hypothetical protein